MPNIKSAMKRVKVTEKQNLRNNIVKSIMKTNIKKFENASGQEAQKLYTVAVSSIDKAALKGVIHKNQANRKKAQLAKKLAAN